MGRRREDAAVADAAAAGKISSIAAFRKKHKVSNFP
jgi:hypothetical protein